MRKINSDFASQQVVHEGFFELLQSDFFLHQASEFGFSSSDDSNDLLLFG